MGKSRSFATLRMAPFYLGKQVLRCAQDDPLLRGKQILRYAQDDPFYLGKQVLRCAQDDLFAKGKAGSALRAG